MSKFLLPAIQLLSLVKVAKQPLRYVGYHHVTTFDAIVTSALMIDYQ